MDPTQSRDNRRDFDRWFEDLYRRYRSQLVRVVLRCLWRGYTSVESIIQDVLLSCAGHLRQSDMGSMDEDELWRLLFRIALRHCNNANHRTSRARQRRRSPVQFSQHNDGEGSDYDPPDRVSPLEVLEREGWIEHILVRLEQKGLGVHERDVFRLKLVGNTLEDIATKTGFTMGRVRTVFARIKRTVEACLSEEVSS